MWGRVSVSDALCPGEAQAGHDCLKGGGEGRGTLTTHHPPGRGARPYPVIHQKVILERKEAPDSGQGFWWRENMGLDGKGK